MAQGGAIENYPSERPELEKAVPRLHHIVAAAAAYSGHHHIWTASHGSQLVGVIRF